MVFSIDSLKEPVGSMKPWIRANTSTALPVNWLICDGSTVADAASPFNGLAIPDYRSRFIRGHNSLTNANFGADVTYFTGGTIPTGGTDSNNLSHQHSEGSHNHGINSDNITHSHPITADGTHNHNDDGGGSGVSGAHSPGEWNNATPAGRIAAAGSHSHGGNTSNQSVSHNHGGGTNNGNGAGTGFTLGSTENRPVFTELLHIIKIK